MSAYIVEDRTINKIITWLELEENKYYHRELAKLGYDMEKQYSIEKLAKDMFFLNCMAVDARYGDNEAEKFRPLNFRFQRVTESSHSVLKALNCWHYQCTEGEEVPNHSLYLLMRNFAGEIAQAIVSRTEEYKTAAWA